MITEKETIKCEAIFNEDRTHRLLWKQVWDKEKPLVCVVMLNACMANTVITDTTTYLVVNNVYRLGDYGGVAIVNLFSLLTPKLRFDTSAILNDEENDSYIKKAAEEASVVILAWGKAADTNLRIAERAKQVVALLGDQKEKLCIISDGKRMGQHPLTPSVRAEWILNDATAWLENFQIQDTKQTDIEQKPEKTKRKKAASK